MPRRQFVESLFPIRRRRIFPAPLNLWDHGRNYESEYRMTMMKAFGAATILTLILLAMMPAGSVFTSGL